MPRVATVESQIVKPEYPGLHVEEVQGSDATEPIARDLVAALDQRPEQVFRCARILVADGVDRRGDLRVGEGGDELRTPVCVAIHHLAEGGDLRQRLPVIRLELRG